ncbi:MAG: NFACT RNA binding domain-containing protein [Spirochaetales bacterium]|nr:NFACT RNA binding domain-containing protein [Spirochaetales bacterium]
MSLNWKEINLILEELDLGGSLIQKIRQPDFKSLLLDLYKPGKGFPLLINLNQGNVRLHRLTGNNPGKVVLQRFAQFLRARINGGRIISVLQVNNDRIILLTILNGKEETHLYIRLWGGASNIIATDSDHNILDAFYRRPRQNEITGGIYFPEEKTITKHGSSGTFDIREYDKSKSFNEFIEKFYRNLESDRELETLKTRVVSVLETRETYIESVLSGLEEKINNFENYSQYKEQAELVKANIYKIQRGDTFLEAENYFDNNNLIKINLDSTLSPGENSALLFDRYKKAKSGLENIRQEITTLNRNLELIKKEREELFAPETSSNSIREFRNFLEKMPKQIRLKEKEKIPGLQFQSGIFTILAGRTATENDLLLRKYVRGNDYWLHTRDYPGGYIFIKAIRSKSIPLEILLDAGNLALFFSKAKKNGKADLYYTQVKHLRRAKDSKKGTVLPTHEKNISIIMDSSRLNRLLGRTQNEEN